MTIRLAATAVLAMSMGAQAQIVAAPDYAQMTHCAAYSLLLAKTLGGPDQAPEQKAAAAALADQATALMLAAMRIDNVPADKVKADVSGKLQAMGDSLSQDGGGAILVEENQASCEALGKLAKAALDQAMPLAHKST